MIKYHKGGFSWAWYNRTNLGVVGHIPRVTPAYHGRIMTAVHATVMLYLGDLFIVQFCAAWERWKLYCGREIPYFFLIKLLIHYYDALTELLKGLTTLPRRNSAAMIAFIVVYGAHMVQDMVLKALIVINIIIRIDWYKI